MWLKNGETTCQSASLMIGSLHTYVCICLWVCTNGKQQNVADAPSLCHVTWLRLLPWATGAATGKGWIRGKKQSGDRWRGGRHTEESLQTPEQMAGEEICSGTREHRHHLMDGAGGLSNGCNIGWTLFLSLIKGVSLPVLLCICLCLRQTMPSRDSYWRLVCFNGITWHQNINGRAQYHRQAQERRLKMSSWTGLLFWLESDLSVSLGVFMSACQCLCGVLSLHWVHCAESPTQTVIRHDFLWLSTSMIYDVTLCHDHR